MIPTLIINGAFTFAVGSLSTTVGNALYDSLYAIGSYIYETKFKKKNNESEEEV